MKLNMVIFTPILKTYSLPSATSGCFLVDIREPARIVASLIITSCLQWADTENLFKGITPTYCQPSVHFPMSFLNKVFSVISEGKCFSGY